MKTVTAKWIDWIRRMQKKTPLVPLDDLARSAMEWAPALAYDVMETIGNYPSSEPELAALQRVWK